MQRGDWFVRAAGVAVAFGLAGAAQAGSVVDVEIGFDGEGFLPLELMDDQLVATAFIDFNETARIWDAFGDPEAQATGHVLESAHMELTAAGGRTWSGFEFQLEVRFFQTVTVEFYAGDDLLQSEMFEGKKFGFQIFDVGEFAGLSGVDRILMYDSGQSFRVDNLSYRAAIVPLPAASGLAVAGLGLVGVRRRRRG